MAKKANTPTKRSSSSRGGQSLKSKSSAGRQATQRRPLKKQAAKPVRKSVNKLAAKKMPARSEATATLVNPAIIFNGNCEEAFTFYRSVFGGKFSYVGRFKEMPPQEGEQMSAEDGEKIMHI